jgi:hypothetical protein
MGINIDMAWKGETEEERKTKELAIDRSAAEVVEGLVAGRINVPGTGRTALGHVGYLFEAYHGGPYATLVLLPEVTGPEVRVAKVPVAAMRSRLGEAMAASRLRARKLYGDETGVLGEAMAGSLADFVALAERKEAETGEPVTVIASL